VTLSHSDISGNNVLEIKEIQGASVIWVKPLDKQRDFPHPSLILNLDENPLLPDTGAQFKTEK
jgi:hypothetical protein